MALGLCPCPCRLPCNTRRRTVAAPTHHHAACLQQLHMGFKHVCHLQLAAWPYSAQPARSQSHIQSPAAGAAWAGTATAAPSPIQQLSLAEALDLVQQHVDSWPSLNDFLAAYSLQLPAEALTHITLAAHQLAHANTSECQIHFFTSAIARSVVPHTHFYCAV